MGQSFTPLSLGASIANEDRVRAGHLSISPRWQVGAQLAPSSQCPSSLALLSRALWKTSLDHPG